MKQILLGSALTLLLSALVGTVSAVELKQYTQEITLEFASPEAAEAAELTKLELPVGKTLAISARWDDTNGEHFLMSQTLAANGWKGTFFLNRCDENYTKNVVAQFVKDGNTVGVHTNHHPHLEQVSPNRMFQEILENRVMLESQTNLCVTTFTFPFGLGREDAANPANPTTAAEQGIALMRSGLLGGPETINMAQRMGLKPEEFVSPYRFVADDKNPNQETFDKGWENGIKQLEAGYSVCGPYMALGTHSWQRQNHPDGFERLGKILATKANVPEYWYCESNEYTAYRLNFVLGTVEKKTVKGNCAVFTVTRFEPQETGSLVSMGLKVSPAPTKVLWGDRDLEVTSDGAFMLPNAPAQTLPSLIDWIPNTTNGSSDAAALSSQEFSGLQIGSQLDATKNVLRVTVSNPTTAAVENLTGCVRLPLKWTGASPTWVFPGEKAPGMVQPGETKTFEIPLGTVDSSARFQKDALFIDNQCDFHMNGAAGRIHSTVTVE